MVTVCGLSLCASAVGTVLSGGASGNANLLFILK